MIGIFDSGIGGLTVAREVMRQLPGFSIVYLGDTARTPYGNKSNEAITRYALENGEWLASHGAKMLVVACNTMSAVALRTLRERFRLPVFDVIGPTVTETVRVSSRKRMGVIGTRATIASKMYEKMIHAMNPDAEIYSAACPLLVPLVEEGWSERDEARRIVRTYLAPLKIKGIDSLILGCTHYPMIAPAIQAELGRRVRVVDSAAATVAQVRGFLDAHPELVDQLPKGNRHEWYLTDVAPQHNEIASAWLGRAITFRRADLVPLPVRQVK